MKKCKMNVKIKNTYKKNEIFSLPAFHVNIYQHKELQTCKCVEIIEILA